MTLSIIYVNYKSSLLIVNSLKELSRLIKIDYEVLIVDNNSDKEELKKITENFEKVKVFFLDENIGFGRASNYGVLKSAGKYVLFLNPDILLVEDFIAPVISFIESNSKIGACSPKLIYENGVVQYSFGFQMNLFYELLEAFYLIGLYRKVFYKFTVNKVSPQEISWVSAACFIVKKSVFQSIGGFNPGYFLNYEDIDLCKKLEDNGFGNYYFPYLKCVHSDHKSFGKNYELLVYSRYQSRLIYAKLHYNFLVRFSVRIIHIIGILIRLLLVNFIFQKDEKKSRRAGYLKSLYLYFSPKF